MLDNDCQTAICPTSHRDCGFKLGRRSVRSAVIRLLGKRSTGLLKDLICPWIFQSSVSNETTWRSVYRAGVLRRQSVRVTCDSNTLSCADLLRLSVERTSLSVKVRIDSQTGCGPFSLLSHQNICILTKLNNESSWSALLFLNGWRLICENASRGFARG